MIYFDNAATTSRDNPSSPHALGIQAERNLRSAAASFAQWLLCREDEIIFTSGGTESNNLAILGGLSSLRRQGGTLLTLPSEHPSVLGPLRFLSENPKFKLVTTSLSEWEKHMSECVFASFTFVNHETGDINDVATISAMLKRANPSVIVHVDGVQGFCKENALLENVDLFSWSSHKFHGPGGVGGLMVRRPVRLAPLMFGGGQQNQLRPGTENVVGIMGMAEAASFLHQNMENNYTCVNAVKSFLKSLADELPGVHVNETLPRVSPYILNMSFEGIKGEVLVHSLSKRGIYASMGAACRKVKARPTLMEMGFGKERALSAVRFSFSHYNTVEEAETAKGIILETVNELRRIHRR